jgi:heme A synthase
LFPSRSLAEGFQQDFSTASHFLIQLRVIHPILAVLVGIYSIVAGSLAAARRPSRTTRRFARALIAISAAQLIVGLTNLALLAPIAIQIVHLFLADMVWLTLVLAAAAALADPAPELGPAPLAEPALRVGHS